MVTKERVEEILTEILTDPKYFVVSVKVSSSKIRRKITVLMDSDEGILIDECAKISREVATVLDEDIDTAYTLEVSSPGVDFPMSTPRQFKRAIGRNIKIISNKGESFIGELLEVNEESFTIQPQKKKKEKVAPTAIKTNFKEIKEAVVQVSFK